MMATDRVGCPRTTFRPLRFARLSTDYRGVEQINMRAPVLEELPEIVSMPKRLAEWCLDELRWTTRVFVSSAERFYWDNGFAKAASLAYTTLLSLVPLSALGFGLLASFAVSNKYLPGVREFLFHQFVPSTDAVNLVLQYLTEFSQTIQTLNVLVMFFVVLTSILLLNSVEYSLNEIWQVFEPRPISHRVAIFCAILVITPVLIISAFYTIQYQIEPFLKGVGIATYLDTFYRYTVTYLFDFVAFVSLYYLVPKAPVRFRSACFGAFVAVLLFDAAKVGFVIYIQNSSYDKIYGALASVPIFLFWLYISWATVLFGAESSYQAQYLPRTGKVWKRSVMSVGDGRMLLAMQSLVMIAQAFIQGKRLPDDLELCETLGCSTVVLNPALDALRRAGIICRAEGRDMRISLMKAPAQITIDEVFDALFKNGGTIHHAAEMKQVFDAFRSPEALHRLTLEQVVLAGERKPATEAPPA